MSVIESNQSMWPRRVAQHMSRLVAGAVLTASALLSGSINIPFALAAPCSDIEVLFARGTFEPPGVGAIGQAFVDSLRSRIGGKSLEVYPVNYPASLAFATAADGVIDASNRVREIAASCPNTSMVLGGYSQGAAVIGYLTMDAVPAGFALPPGITGPLPPEVTDHVAAVALFGKPSNGFLNSIHRDAPPIAVGHLYMGKTIDLCVSEDPICSPTGSDSSTHGSYAVNGMTEQAVEFTVSHLRPTGPSNPLQLSGVHR
jgi:cutinase